MATKTKKKSKTSKNAPKSMDDLLEKYSKTLKVHSKGDKIKAKVVEKRKDALVLDIGGKSEGLVKGSAFDESKGYIKNLEIGDEVEGKVIVSETPEGFSIVSLRQASADAVWKKIERVKKQKKKVRVLGKSVNSSGILVEVEGLIGFIPNSHIGKNTAKNLSNMVEKRFEAVVLEINREANKIILSERAVSEAEEMEKASKAIEKVKKDEILEGKVTGVVDFGCFVEIKIGKEKVSVEGLVHVSEMGWEKVGKPSDLVKEGQKVKVKIIGKEEGKLAFSMRQAKKDPWEEIEEKYKVDTRVKGKVTKISDFGVFVATEPGIEGLIHITKIPPNKKLKVGDEVNAYVESVDNKTRKLSLGLILTAKPVGYK